MIKNVFAVVCFLVTLIFGTLLVIDSYIKKSLIEATLFLSGIISSGVTLQKILKKSS
ncbi:MAG TPA: hypothetical protein PLL26_05680 [Candidatus Dojkabacteria bacterium]|nr:hypothetical protein [Candidatus Dojkabacteria bacterium]